MSDNSINWEMVLTEREARWFQSCLQLMGEKDPSHILGPDMFCIFVAGFSACRAGEFADACDAFEHFKENCIAQVN
jgi:hypothetical protein